MKSALLAVLTTDNDDDAEPTAVEQAYAEGDWMIPVSEEAAASKCDCCENRHLGIYRSDCLRCYARCMSRGVPRLERARRDELAKLWDAERMSVLRRFIAEERVADRAVPHYSRLEGNA